jgi:pyridoxamine 5'-phosphate oxidase
MADGRQKKIRETIGELLHAATTKRSPFTVMQLATVDANGAPKARGVVLREASDERMTLITDLRSPKAKEISAQAHVALSGYDTDSCVQLRIEGRAQINADEERRRSFWNTLRPHTHLLYRSPLAPGTEVSAPEETHTGAEPHPLDSAELYEHFGLVDVVIDCFDWLDLSSEPPIRCRFARIGDSWEASWLAP